MQITQIVLYKLKLGNGTLVPKCKEQHLHVAEDNRAGLKRYCIQYQHLGTKVPSPIYTHLALRNDDRSHRFSPIYKHKKGS
jgi:hypothetical protein